MIPVGPFQLCFYEKKIITNSNKIVEDSKYNTSFGSQSLKTSRNQGNSSYSKQYWNIYKESAFAVLKQPQKDVWSFCSII